MQILTPIVTEQGLIVTERIKNRSRTERAKESSQRIKNRTRTERAKESSQSFKFWHHILTPNRDRESSQSFKFWHQILTPNRDRTGKESRQKSRSPFPFPNAPPQASLLSKKKSSSPKSSTSTCSNAWEFNYPEFSKKFPWIRSFKNVKKLSWKVRWQRVSQRRLLSSDESNSCCNLNLFFSCSESNHVLNRTENSSLGIRLSFSVFLPMENWGKNKGKSTESWIFI